MPSGHDLSGIALGMSLHVHYIAFFLVPHKFTHLIELGHYNFDPSMSPAHVLQCNLVHPCYFSHHPLLLHYKRLPRSAFSA